MTLSLKNTNIVQNYALNTTRFSMQDRLYTVQYVYLTYTMCRVLPGLHWSYYLAKLYLEVMRTLVASIVQPPFGKGPGRGQLEDQNYDEGER
jgi:hypothetical protein